MDSDPDHDVLKEIVFPFSSGKRACVGQNLALLELKLVRVLDAAVEQGHIARVLMDCFGPFDRGRDGMSRQCVSVAHSQLIAVEDMLDLLYDWTTRPKKL